MAFADADYDYDVFISYAHDDKPQGGGSNWILRFKQQLTYQINSLTGTKYNRIYFDEDVQTYNARVKSILHKVTRSKVLLIIGSPNWANSRWCQDEAEAFVRHHGDSAQIFVAEMMGLRDGRYPAAVSELLQARFWQKDNSGTRMTLTSGDKKYKHLVARLANQMCDALDGMSAGAARPAQREPLPSSAPPVAPKGAATKAGQPEVVVAYAADEVDDERASLISYLKDLGVAVAELPADMPRPAAELEAALAAVLDDRSVYVHLLGRKKQRIPDEAHENATDLQFGAAEAVLPTVDIFLWRPDDIDPERNPDEGYKQLLRHAENQSIPELAQAIADRIRTKRPSEAPAGAADVPIVVINADAEDQELADRLSELCWGRTCEAIVDDCELNDDRRQQWADASAVAFVQGRADRGWLIARYSIFKRERASRAGGSDLRGQAVVYGPPAPKRLGTIVAPNLDVIDASSDDFNAAPFETWLDKIGARRATG
jgi:hypothetical protein